MICYFGNLGAALDWLNLGSLQTPQGQRAPPAPPAELHTGTSEASMGPGETREHLAVEDDKAEGEDDDEAAEDTRDSWVRRS